MEVSGEAPGPESMPLVARCGREGGAPHGEGLPCARIPTVRVPCTGGVLRGSHREGHRAEMLLHQSDPE